MIFTQFKKKRFLSLFSTFSAPPWTTPHPMWPEFVPPYPLSPTNLKMTLRIKIIYDFWIFSAKLVFLPFLSILAPEDPLLRAGLVKWGLWEAFWGNQAPLLTQYRHQNCGIIYFFCQEPILVHAKLWYLVILHLNLKMDALKGSRGRREVRIVASGRGWWTSYF